MTQRRAIRDGLWGAALIVGVLLFGPLLWLRLAYRWVAGVWLARLQAVALPVRSVAPTAAGWLLTLADGRERSLSVASVRSGVVYRVCDGHDGFHPPEERTVLDLRVDDARLVIAGASASWGDEGPVAQLGETLLSSRRVRGPWTVASGGGLWILYAIPGTALWGVVLGLCCR